MTKIRIEDIEIGDRLRPPGEALELAKSIEKLGLLNPITVTPNNKLIAGHHRVLAAKLLAWDEIECTVVELDELAARMAEIDENLIRNELTALERAEHLAERKRVGEALGKWRKPGRPRNSENFSELNSEPKESFTQATARELGETDRNIRNDISLANKLPSSIRDRIRDTAIADNKQELKRLARLTPDEQTAVVTRIVSGEARGVREAKRDTVAAEIRSEPTPMPTGPFRVIVADPPWAYEKRKDDASHRSALDYPSMSTEEVCEMAVGERAHDDCVLWLWTTNAFMRDAFAVLDAWGFKEKTILTWAKDRMGCGDWLRGKSEHCIMAIRGKPTVVLTNQTTLLNAPLRQHSRKPDEFYELVDVLCPGSKLELFSREPREGWHVWGAETDKFNGAS